MLFYLINLNEVSNSRNIACALRSNQQCSGIDVGRSLSDDGFEALRRCRDEVSTHGVDRVAPAVSVYLLIRIPAPNCEIISTLLIIPMLVREGCGPLIVIHEK